MDWQDIAGTVARAAPVLGAVLGGPVGAVATAAGGLLASVLGVEAQPSAVAQAITADPEAMLKLRQIEADERARLLDWQTEQVRAELENVKDARAMAVELRRSGDIMSTLAPALISLVVVLGFFGMLYAVLNVELKNTEASLLLLGTLSTGFGAVLNYYLGSSLGSFRKDAGQVQGKR